MMRAAAQRAPSRTWCFTDFDVSPQRIDELKLIATKECTKMVCGLETGASGHAHLQGFVIFRRPCRMPGCKRMLNKRELHVEIAVHPEQAELYCRKDGDIKVDFRALTDSNPGQGTRTDLIDAVRLIQAGGPRALLQDHPSILLRYPAGVRYVASFDRPPENRDVFVCVFIGAPGAGKTRAASQWPDAYWPTVASTPWFDGYERQTTIILDEYRGQYPVDFFKRLIDRYPLQLPVKGSFTVARFSTSSSPPRPTTYKSGTPELQLRTTTPSPDALAWWSGDRPILQDAQSPNYDPL